MNISKTQVYCKTDVGNRRPNNEDQCGFLEKKNFKVLLVADGMGGHASGEVASKMAKEMILKLFNLEDSFSTPHQLKATIKKIVKKTNQIIHKLSSTKEEFYGMGTTLVLAVITDFATAIVNCGDSRIYALKDNKLQQLTRDQTVVNYLYEIHAISKEEMKTSPKRHVLMSALGIAPSVDFDLTLIDNDYQGLLLCSDGLTNMVEDEDIEKIWNSRFNLGPDSLCNDLIDTALINGGIDNIAVTILEVK